MKIVTYPNPVLVKTGEKVPTHMADLPGLLQAMKATMRRAKGVGLAAPQVGRSIQLAVLEYEPDKDEQLDPIPFQVLMNPKILSASREMEHMMEGCLSLPGLEVDVPRARKIKVRAMNENGEIIQFRASGFHARIIQHELDHLNGKLIIDYVTDKKRALKDYEAARNTGKTAA